MSDKEYDYFLKLLLIGNSYVGKTSLIYRFVDNFWEDNFIPIVGVDFVRNNKIIYFYRKSKNLK